MELRRRPRGSARWSDFPLLLGRKRELTFRQEPTASRLYAMGRLIVASVRLPVSMARRSDGTWHAWQSPGGLVSALRPTLKECDHVWLGWPGTVVGSEERPVVTECLAEYGAAPLFLENEEVAEFYEGYSNAGLWPLFHGFPSRVRFPRRDWERYRSVNARFADAIQAQSRPGDIIWVHDYQLALVPGMLRSRGIQCPIGYFLHVPFPSAEIYRSLPARAELLTGLLGADLIGFHDYSYVRHFRSACLRVLGLEAEPERVRYRSRYVHLAVLPIGIDPLEIDQMRNGDVAQAELVELRSLYGNKKLVVGVDRLDYTKGIPEKLRAFEELLTRHPEWRGKTVLIQIAAPSRTGVEEYQQLKRELDELVGRINGAFGGPAYTPVVYVNQSLSRERLVGLYAAADVALITPLRDGMNLVALEYVAARGSDPGALILSEFTGTAHSMAGARVVNPYDSRAVSDALHDVLSEGEPNREAFAHMKAFVRQNTAGSWSRRFVSLLTQVADTTGASAQVLRVDSPPLVTRFMEARRPLLLLDYDGTLRGFENEPDAAKPDARILKVLERLAMHATVYVSSGRIGERMDEWFGHLPIGLVAEHGLGTRPPGEDWKYREVDPELLFRIVEPMMRDFVERTPGSSLERKRVGLAWHYRAVEPELGMLRAMDLITSLQAQVHRNPLNVLRGNKVVEVRHTAISKEQALHALLERHSDADLVFCAGDDQTDEEMFLAIPPGLLARTVRCWVGWRNPVAEHWVDSPESFVTQLETLVGLWESLPQAAPHVVGTPSW